MRRLSLLSTGLLVGSLAIGNSALAQVSAAEAAKLGDTLTPIGAEKAGNGDQIPEWTGGLTEAPANYQGDGRYVDPFPQDQMLFKIDRSNVDQYADNLTPGQIATIKTYDDYFIPVF